MYLPEFIDSEGRKEGREEVKKEEKKVLTLLYL